MKDYKPYNAGEFRKSSAGDVMICGHIWWPVEKRNAYHCLAIDKDKQIKNDNPIYEWDNTNGQWPLIA